MDDAFKRLVEVFNLLTEACQTIQENNACGDCPLNGLYCLEDAGFSVNEMFEETSAKTWERFITYADHVDGAISKEDYKALLADDMRKALSDEMM